VQDRANSGSGHGWSGAQIMFWNCTSPDFVVQDPPSNHCNWAIGCVGPITNVGQWTTNPLGIVESKGTKIAAIPSLFKAQLAFRLKNLSTDNLLPRIESPDFQINPNPATHQFQVKIKLNESTKIGLTLCDMNGKLIKNLRSNEMLEAGTNSLYFNTQGLTSGIYFVQLNYGSQQLSSKLILKK